MDILQQLAESEDRLRAYKAERKKFRNELALECSQAPGWEQKAKEKQEAANALKLIKAEVADRTGLGADLKDVQMKIDIEQDMISGCIAQLIAEGKLKMGDSLDLGQMVIQPTFRVNLNAQMKLNI